MYKRSAPILLLSISFLLCSQPKTSQKSLAAGTFLSTCYMQKIFNGAVLISENGKIIYKNIFGFADYDSKDTLTVDSRFRMASVTKQFTAMAVMLLHEDDKLDYDQRINTVLPELPYPLITIRHLLTHTSGLADYDSLFDATWDVGRKGLEDRQIATNHDVLAVFSKLKPLLHFTPGEKFEYSNTGYVFLAVIVERLSGQSYSEFLRERIFDPLNMSHSLIYSAVENPPVERRVYGFRKTLLDSIYRSIDHHYLNGIVGDGALYSTLDDLFVWDQALYTGQLLSPEKLADAFTPVTLNDGSHYNYGFGWRIDSTDQGGKVLSHTGGWVGFRTYIHREPEYHNTLIVLTNNSNIYAAQINKALLNILHQHPYTMPKISIAQIIGPVISRRGIDEAINLYIQLKLNSKEVYDFSEPVLNFLGYELLQNKNTQDAISIFKLNADAFPNSANVYDSLGEAYMRAGQNKKAAENYRKSLSLDKNNDNARKMLTRLN